MSPFGVLAFAHVFISKGLPNLFTYTCIHIPTGLARTHSLDWDKLCFIGKQPFRYFYKPFHTPVSDKSLFGRLNKQKQPLCTCELGSTHMSCRA